MIDYYKYLGDISNASRKHSEWLRTKDGAKYLARCFGYGLRGANKKILHDIVISSYSKILIIGSNLQPPIDNKEWIKEIYKGLES